MRTKNCGVEELVRLGLPPSWSLENGKLVINDVRQVPVARPIGLFSFLLMWMWIRRLCFLVRQVGARPSDWLQARLHMRPLVRHYNGVMVRCIVGWSRNDTIKNYLEMSNGAGSWSRLRSLENCDWGGGKHGRERRGARWASLSRHSCIWCRRALHMHTSADATTRFSRSSCIWCRRALSHAH